MLDVIKLISQVPDDADQAACCLLLAASEQASTFEVRAMLEDAVAHILSHHGLCMQPLSERLARVLAGCAQC